MSFTRTAANIACRNSPSGNVRRTSIWDTKQSSIEVILRRIDPWTPCDLAASVYVGMGLFKTTSTPPSGDPIGRGAGGVAGGCASLDGSSSFRSTETLLIVSFENEVAFSKPG